MVALKIEDLKGFTSKLFVGDVFDRWLLREAAITTFNVFTIDGRVRRGYYTEQELEENAIGQLSAWKAVRPFCFSLIKGKNCRVVFILPFSFHPPTKKIF